MIKKRILSAFLSVCTLFSGVYAAVPVTAADNAVTIFSDDFSGANLAASGWGKTGGAAAVSIAAAGGAYGSVLQYKSTWDRCGINLTPVTSGTVQISFDINPHEIAADIAANNVFELYVLRGSMKTDITPDTDSGDDYWTVLRLSKLQDTMYLSPTIAVSNGKASNLWLEPSVENGIAAKTDEWIRADISVNLDEGKIDYYFNGKYYCTNSSEELKSVFDSVGALLFRGNNFSPTSSVYIDNVSVKTSDEKMAVSETSMDAATGTIDVKFNSTILSDTILTADNVSVAKLGGGTLNVTDVTKVTGDTMRISYSGEPDMGREYKISVNGGVKSVYGGVMNEDVLFNAPARRESAHITENFNDRTNDNSLPQFIAPTSVSAEDQQTAIEAKGSDGSNVLKLFRTPVTEGKTWKNMLLSMDLSDRADLSGTTGRLNLCFDVYFEDWRAFRMMYQDANGAVDFMYADRNGLYTYNGTKKSDAMCSYTCKKWNSVKVVFDCDNSKVIYYLNGENVGEQLFASLNSVYSGTMQSFSFVSYIENSANDYFYIDNIDIWREESVETVSRVRFTDADNNEVIGDALDEGVKNIKITFANQQDSTLLKENVKLTNSVGEEIPCTGSLSEDGFTYTLAPTAEGLASDSGYKLTIGKGTGITNDVVYGFSVGSVGITSIDGYTKAMETEVGTSLSELNLPPVVTGHYTSGGATQTVEIPVKWQADKYYSYTPGVYSINGLPTMPNGFAYSGEIEISLTVKDSTETQLISGAEIHKTISERSPIASGGLSSADSLQMGLAAGVMTLTARNFTDCQYSHGGTKGAYAIADSEGGESINGYAKAENDGEIEIGFEPGYDGSHAVNDIKLVFTNITDYRTADTEWTKVVDEFTGWDMDLFYKNSVGEWIKFYSDKTDLRTYRDEGANVNGYGTTSFTNGIFPTLILNNLSSELNDVYGLKIRVKAQDGKEYKLVEADVNMTDDGNAIAAKRAECTKQIRMSKVYSDGAVIQRDKPITVTGFCGADGEKIDVSITDGANAVRTGTAVVKDGKWQATLDSMSGGKDTYKITAVSQRDSANRAEISDILFGDVFLASGQSNMEFSLNSSVTKIARYDKTASEQIKTDAAGDGNIRFFTQQSYRSAIVPIDDVYTGKWRKNTAFNNVSPVSAVSYFFAKKLYEELGGEIPIAVYTAARSGSDVRAWMPEETYLDVCGNLTDIERSNYNHGNVRVGCWNAIIAPLTSMKVKGVIWYQGEGNASQYNDYKTWFPSMVSAWRKAFGDDELSFNTVQIAGWDSTDNFIPFREMQLQLALKDDNVDIAAAIDLGETGGDPNDDIHYGYKQPVGERLAKNALVRFYGKNIENSGPLFEKAVKTDTGIEVSFTHADGLKAQSRTSLYSEDFTPDTAIKSLEISTDGAAWEKAASAQIEGGKIKIECGSEYTYVRYGCIRNAVTADDISGANLYNGDNMPAYPFSACTDDVMGTVSVNTDGIKASIEIAVPIKSMLTNNAKLIIGRYNSDGTLKSAEIRDMTFILNDNTTYVIEEELNGASYIKAYVFDDMTSIKPLAK